MSSELKPALRFRDFLQVLKDENDLVEIEQEIDPNLEAGAIMRRAYEEKLPVPLMKNLKQDPRNPDPKNLFGMVGCIGGLRNPREQDHARIAHHLGLPASTPMNEIIDFLLECKKKKPIPPTLVDNSKAPFKKNKLVGDQVNLNALPAPVLHEEDGGKYIQTYGMFILQTPDKSWTNWSIARAMIYDDKHLTGLVVSPQHIRQVADKWEEVGKLEEVPYVLAFGVPPAAILVSSMPIPEGSSESDYVGAICGESLPVVKADTNELLIPAESEFVLEGTLNINKLVNEGPFGEMHAYVFPGTAHPSPLYKVDQISYRDESILPVSNPGLCTDETHTLIGGLISAECKQSALDHPVLSKVILDVFTPYESQALWLAFRVNVKELVKLNTTSEELRKLIGEHYFARKIGMFVHEIILVGDDIDIFDFRKFIWAYTTRHTPGDDQTFFNDCVAFILAPFIANGPRLKLGKGGKVVTDCLFPQQYTDPDFKFITCAFANYPQEVTKKIESNWSTYGYK